MGILYLLLSEGPSCVLSLNDCSIGSSLNHGVVRLYPVDILLQVDQADHSDQKRKNVGYSVHASVFAC